MTVSKIRGAAATIQNLHLIVIDYLGLMQADRRADSRNLELGQISRDLKNLASELQIPIVAAAQLNRGVNDTDRPTLLSLRDSGELEQNGSKVLFLWRIDDSGTIGVSVAKNRRGRQGVVQMTFDGALKNSPSFRSRTASQRKNAGADFWRVAHEYRRREERKDGQNSNFMAEDL